MNLQTFDTRFRLCNTFKIKEINEILKISAFPDFIQTQNYVKQLLDMYLCHWKLRKYLVFKLMELRGLKNIKIMNIFYKRFLFSDSK